MSWPLVSIWSRICRLIFLLILLNVCVSSAISLVPLVVICCVKWPVSWMSFITWARVRRGFSFLVSKIIPRAKNSRIIRPMTSNAKRSTLSLVKEASVMS